MKLPARSRALVALLSAAAFAGCTESIGPITDPDLDEALDEIAAAEALAAPGVSMMGGTPAPSPGAPVPCVYNASNKRFECPSVTMNGVTMTRYYQLLDAGGAPQSSMSTSVVAIKNVMDASGTLTPPPSIPNAVPVQMTSHDESTLSGLRSETKTMTGTGTSAYTVTPPGGVASTSRMTRSTNLTLPKPAPDVYPTGTITMAMSIDPSTTPVMTMTMTYNGTSIVTMTSTMSGTTRTCTHDLKSPQTPPVCSS
jgi:hypothetical protein